MTDHRGAEHLERLDPVVVELLRKCGHLAAERGEVAYLVGGSVRDLLLGRDCEDIDVVIVGDGLAMAQAIARRDGGKLTRYHAFQTARVDLPEAGRIDFATARAEIYPRPGQLPRVSAGSLRDDLARRDFTINTLALGLNPDHWGCLQDPFDGRADLANGLIRFLHERSFADDPTRLLRALRFANRLGYRVEPRTAAGIDEAARGGYLEEISGDRLRRELHKLLAEQPVLGPEALGRHGLLDGIVPGLRVDLPSLQRLQRILEDARLAGSALHCALRGTDVAPLVLAVLAKELEQPQRWQLVRRLAMSKNEREAVIGSGVAWRRARECARQANARPSGVAACLDALALSTVVVGWAVEDRVAIAESLSRYLGDWRWLHATLDGRDVAAAGVSEGAAIGRILERLRAARLDGEVADEAGEREMLDRLLRDGLN